MIRRQRKKKVKSGDYDDVNIVWGDLYTASQSVRSAGDAAVWLRVQAQFYQQELDEEISLNDAILCVYAALAAIAQQLSTREAEHFAKIFGQVNLDAESAKMTNSLLNVAGVLVIEPTVKQEPVLPVRHPPLKTSTFETGVPRKIRLED